MTSPTNAPRDWPLEADRLRVDDCQQHQILHGGEPTYLRKYRCRQCLTEALRAAYEAGRADAGATSMLAAGPLEPPAGYCDCDPVSGSPGIADASCDCCHAPAGEPCRHEVRHD